jgi:hypothetical protein
VCEYKGDQTEKHSDIRLKTLISSLKDQMWYSFLNLFHLFVSWELCTSSSLLEGDEVGEEGGPMPVNHSSQFCRWWRTHPGSGQWSQAWYPLVEGLAIIHPIYAAHHLRHYSQISVFIIFISFQIHKSWIAIFTIFLFKGDYIFFLLNCYTFKLT